MTLTEAQIEDFYREGYVVVPSLVPESVIDCVVAVAKARVGETQNWQPTIFDGAHPQKDAPLHALLVEPNVVGAVEQLLSSPPRVYYGMLAVVAAHGGNGLPWHQDNQYEHILGGALNVFIALCDITIDKAILWVAPRSHLSGVLPSQANGTTAPGHREALIEPENGMPLPGLKKGDACIFDRNTLHRSLKNETAEPRFAYAAQYVADQARSAATGRHDLTLQRTNELAQRLNQGR